MICQYDDGPFMPSGLYSRIGFLDTLLCSQHWFCKTVATTICPSGDMVFFSPLFSVKFLECKIPLDSMLS